MNIGADSTLVASAGSLARSMGPADMTKSLDNMLEERGKLLDTIEANFKKAVLAADIAGSELRDTLDTFGVKLNNGELSQPEREEMQAKMEDYRARMKAIPFGRKGKKQREDLMYEINREIKTAANRDAAVTDVLSTLENNLYDPNQLGANYTNFLNQIAKNAAEEETDPGFSKTKNEKGETVYSYKFTNEAGEEETIEGTIFDIQKKINGTKKDYEFIKNQNESIFGWQKWATDHPNAKFDDVYNRISSDMETSFNAAPDKFKSVINHPMGWSDKSYVETLQDTSSPEFKQVLSVLNDLDASEFDYDGDGDIDDADFVNEENVNAMIKALTDPDASQRRVAHKAAAKFYADTEARKAFDFGVNDRRNTGEGGDEGSDESDGKFTDSNHMVNNQQVKFTAKFKETTRNAINNREEVVGNYGIYTWTEGTEDELGFYTGPDGEKLTPFQVANREYSTGGDGSSHSDFKETLGEGSVDETPTGFPPPSSILNDSDDDSASALNDWFSGLEVMYEGERVNFSDRFDFRPRGGISAWGGRDIVLFDKVRQDVVVDENWTSYKNKGDYRFRTGPNHSGMSGQDLLDEMMAAPLLEKFVKAKLQMQTDELEDPNNPN